jgi:hypothetical protein
VIIAHVGAEIAFERPERDDDRRRHAILLIDAAEHRCIGLDLRRAGLDAIGRSHAIGKFQKCLAKDALAVVDIHDPLIVGQIWRGFVDSAL